MIIIHYLIKRIFVLIPVALGVSLLVFLAISFTPSNPVEIMLGINATEEMEAQLSREFGLDKPVLVQYGLWLFRLIHGDMGKSIVTGVPVLQELISRFPVTFQLTILGVLLSLLIAIPIGILSAIRKNTITDFFIRLGALSGISLPNFAIAILLILFCSKVFGWLPPIGFVSLWDDPLKSLQILILPVISLGIRLAASVSRMTRSSMLEVLLQDYIRTAKAKGLNNFSVVYKHAFQNALIPVLTLVGLQIGYLLGGAVIIEEIFSLPGIGRFLLTGIYRRDYPVVMGCVLLIAILFTIINTFVDILYALIDPRIRYQ